MNKLLKKLTLTCPVCGEPEADKRIKSHTHTLPNGKPYVVKFVYTSQRLVEVKDYFPAWRRNG
jgi:hypothetical protein